MLKDNMQLCLYLQPMAPYLLISNNIGAFAFLISHARYIKDFIITNVHYLSAQ